jgi:hypothetical protein
MSDELRPGNKIQKAGVKSRNRDREFPFAAVEIMRTLNGSSEACTPTYALRVPDAGGRLALHRSAFIIHR